MASKRGEQGAGADRMRRLEEDFEWIAREKVRGPAGCRARCESACVRPHAVSVLRALPRSLLRAHCQEPLPGPLDNLWKAKQ